MRDELFGNSDTYVSAFSAVLGEGLPSRQYALLNAHFGAPGHTASAQQLAEAIGYKAFIGVNSAYAHLAKRIAAQLGR